MPNISEFSKNSHENMAEGKNDPFPKYQKNLGIAVLLMMGFGICASLLDSIAKSLSHDLPVLQVVWARYFFHLLLLLPLVLYVHRLKAFTPNRAKSQILRASFLLLSTCFYFTALSKIYMANAQALVFSAPLTITILSPFLLKEKVGIYRISAVIVGFIGMLVIINPSFDSSFINVGSFYAVLAGITYAFYILLTRLLHEESALITLFFTGLIGSVVLSILMPFIWVAPSPYQWGFMAGIGICGAIAHLFLIFAYRFADASQLSPWMYAKLLFTSIAGYLFFSEMPSSSTWLGASIIVIAGIYIWHRERVRKAMQHKNA